MSDQNESRKPSSKKVPQKANSQNSESKKKLTPEQFEKIKAIYKKGFLMRLNRKGLLKMPSKMLH
jgi:predicted DNA binding protein